MVKVVIEYDFRNVVMKVYDEKDKEIVIKEGKVEEYKKLFLVLGHVAKRIKEKKVKSGNAIVGNKYVLTIEADNNIEEEEQVDLEALVNFVNKAIPEIGESFGNLITSLIHSYYLTINQKWSNTNK